MFWKCFIGLGPHDPNIITAFEEGICPNQLMPNLLSYRVDFQNLGRGYAEDVTVEVSVNPDIVDASSILDFVIQTSHSYEVTDIGNDYLKFKFKEINLPGTIQVYPQTYALQDTKGWIEFTLKTWPCISDKYEAFNTSGEIVFIWSGGVQYTPMNMVSQAVYPEGSTRYKCESDPECSKPIPHNVQHINPDRVAKSNEALAKPTDTNFVTSFYPNPFVNEIEIEVFPLYSELPIVIELVDLTGKVWLMQSGIYTSRRLEALPTSNLPAGLYFLKMSNGDQVQSHKIIKQ